MMRARHDPPTTGAAAPEAEAGFTIAEVLVAFALTALGTLLALEIAGMTARGARRLDAARVAADEAEAVVLRRVAAGDLQASLVEGRFSDGSVWTLSIADARPPLGLAQVRVPTLWRLRVTRGGPDGDPLYTTLMPGRPDG